MNLKYAAPRWRWKVADPALNARLTLLYEPGNWGDLLKNAWAVCVARHLCAAAPGRSFTCLDPFAGAPVYPLLDASRRRLTAVGGLPGAALQRRFARRGQWASTAVLVRAAVLAAGARPRLRVFDLREEHRAAWRGLPGVAVAEARTGEELLREAGGAPRAAPRLILVDPYDFFDHWGRFLALLKPLFRRAVVLVYLFNKSLRGAGFLDQYARLRRKLRAELPSESRLFLGRVPADRMAPRACHEMLLLAPRHLVGEVGAELRRATARLAELLEWRDVYFEEGGDG